MTTDPGCGHEFLQIASDVFEPSGQDFRFVVLNVRCAGCHVLFSFRGLNSGVPNADEPVVSADGYELRAPIVPGAGAVVGLLTAVGLEDELRHPSEVFQDDDA